MNKYYNVIRKQMLPAFSFLVVLRRHCRLIRNTDNMIYLTGGLMMKNFHVNLKKVVDDSYDIEIGHNLFENLINDLKNGLIKGADKYAIITDSEVEKLYAQKLLELMRAEGFNADIFVFKAGEKSKTRSTKEFIEDSMLKKSYRRDSCIIAVGGGVVTDLAGFMAGTYGRGIPFINYATTLLAAADASIGGKTAVDTELATNLIGMFNQPDKVYIDIETWKTLPARQIRSGLSETIKQACLGDKEFFEFLENNVNKVIDENGVPVLDKDVCEHIAEKNCEIKYRVVSLDEKEKSLREVLNLGHTVGRAIETVSEYKLLHGEAVAIGMAFEVKAANKLGYVTDSEMSRVINLYKKAGLPTKIPQYVDDDILVKKLYTDKKVKAGKIRFVFQDGIGKIKQFEGNKYSTPVNEDFICQVIREMRNNG